MQNAKMKRRITRLAIAGAWIAVITIAYATLTHVGFVYAIYFKLAPYLMRPAMQTYAHFEHVIAFAILGALFGFAYPRRLTLVCCIVFGAAAALEPAIPGADIEKIVPVLEALEAAFRPLQTSIPPGTDVWTGPEDTQ